MTDEQRRALQRLLAISGAKARTAMDLRAMGVDDIVRASGLARSTVYDFLAGSGSPRLITLVGIAAALEVDPRALLPTLKELRAHDPR